MPVANPGVLDGVRRIAGRFRDVVIDGGLPGVPLGLRLRGATTSGPPTVGTSKAGDIVLDRKGTLWACVTGGTGTGAVWAPAGPFTSAKGYGATGNGVTDDTAALTAWVNAVNATTGTVAFLNPGQYMISSALPAVTANAVTFLGAGWAQAANTAGSVISASAAYSGGPVLALAGEGIQVQGLTVDGGGFTSQVITVTGQNCMLTGMQARGVAGSTALTTPGFPASGTPVTNSTGSNAYVTITGGTASNVVVNGVSVASFSPCLVYLPAGQSITVTYTVAPSWTWATPGVLVDVQAGGTSCWVTDCRLNAVNYPTAALQVNATDLILRGSKPVNTSYGVMLLPGSSGAQIQGNHITPGASGQNCIWVQGNPSRVAIQNNRFDNFVNAAVQLTPPSSTPNDLCIDGNDFYSTVQAAGFPLIGVDTTANSWRGLAVRGNTGYAGGTNIPAYVIGTYTQAGVAATGTSKLASLGSTVTGNSFYATTALIGPAGAATVALGNMLTTNGTTYAQATDTYTFPAATQSTSDQTYKQSGTAVTPSATANTFGATVTLSPDGTFTGLAPLQVQYVTTGVATETVTMQTTVTWSDTTTTVASTNVTANGTTSLSAINLISALAGGDGKHATSVAFAAKSTIASSTASIVPTVLGLNQN